MLVSGGRAELVAVEKCDLAIVEEYLPRLAIVEEYLPRMDDEETTRW